MNAFESKTIAELQVALGERLRALRLFRNIDQQTVAEKAGVSLRALRKLELGQGSNVETLLRVLKALDALNLIDTVSPPISVSPMTLLRRKDPPRRVRRPRTTTPAPLKR